LLAGCADINCSGKMEIATDTVTGHAVRCRCFKELTAVQSKLEQSLNPTQRQAVEHGHGPLLILAGAGSGKTRVLTHRIAHLVNNAGISPSRILAITFTNKAASEMRERLFRLLPEARDLWISTFHAAALRMLKQHGDAIGLNRNFVVYDTQDQLALVKTCCRQQNIDLERYPPQALLAAISNAKNNLQDAEEFAGASRSYYADKVSSVYLLYDKLLRQHNALDFDDLLLLVVKLFTQSPSVREHYQVRFQHILVDEYQDTNFAQYTLTRLLAARHRNLSVVGDDDQSIYRWRGANLRNILDFERDYPETAVFKLEQNYRSTGCILTAANGVIEHNITRKEKRLWTANHAGEPVTLFTALTEQEEALFVAHTITGELAARGRYAFADCAVLYRMHAQSRVFEEVFMRLGIPYRIIGGLRFYERKEVKDLLAYLRLIANVSDDVSFRRVVNVPARGIGEVSMMRLETYARTKGCSLFTAAAEGDGAALGLKQGTLIKLVAFTHQIAAWARQAEFIELHELVTQVLEQSGLMQQYMADISPEAMSRQENLTEVVSVAKDFAEKNPDSTLTDFLNSVSLVTADDDEGETQGGKTTLMTLHSAKGLEFPVVFLVGLEEGVFPHSRVVHGEEAELEEERRLCYVGITRAKERLFLTCAKQRLLFGKTNYSLPSRFVAEIPASCLVYRGNLGERVMAAPQFGEHRTQAAAKSRPADTAALTLADKVSHPKFGVGTVVNITAKGEDTLVTVAFAPPYGIKVLSLQYAALTVVR